MFLPLRTSKLVVSQILQNSYRCIHKRDCLCITNSQLFKHDCSKKFIFTSGNIGFDQSFYNDIVRLAIHRSGSNYILCRHISLSSVSFSEGPLKPSSKVKVTVEELKKIKDDSSTGMAEIMKPVVKKSLREKVVDEILHYYHGFRLLFIDMKISSVLLFRVLNGNSLTRREYRLLTRTVADMFRLVPFSVFIIVPFMELLLPVFIKLFPGLLPSTFQTATEKEDKNKKNLKVKLEMAKFLQETLDNMSVQHKDHNSVKAKEFKEWFQKVRTSGEQVSNEDIMKYSKLFEDEITLDSLSRSQLIALCRVLEVQTLGTNMFLRFQLRMKLRSLAADDKMIQKEGVDSLNLSEVQQACRSRGMRAYGVSEERLRNQLSQWLDLSLNERVPQSLLLLSRALMLPETIPTSDKLKATISTLSENIVFPTTAAIGEKEGKIDNRVKLAVLKEEERKIKEERKEAREEKMKEKTLDKEVIIDKAPIISTESTPVLVDSAPKVTSKSDQLKKKDHLRSKDVEIIENAIDTMSQEKKNIVETGEIEHLKEEMAEYKEDVESLQKEVSSQPKPEIRESKAAKRLFKRVNKLITKLDTVLVDLNKKELQLKKDLELEQTPKKKEEILKIDDIIATIKRIKDVPDQSRLDKITSVLRKMDDDCDGSVKVEDVLKVIEIIGKENVHLSDKQVDELIELIDKEEIIEVEDKIEKALLKDKETNTPEVKAECAPMENVEPEEKDYASKVEKPSTSGSNTIPKVKAKTAGISPHVNSIEKNSNKTKTL